MSVAGVIGAKPSPPHRWLRKVTRLMDKSQMPSPPHRWLRNYVEIKASPAKPSPPHRWLRKTRYAEMTN